MPVGGRSMRATTLATLAIALVSIVALTSQQGDQRDVLGSTTTIAAALFQLFIAALVLGLSLVALALLGALVGSLSRRRQRRPPEHEIVREPVPFGPGAVIILVLASLTAAGVVLALAYVLIGTVGAPTEPEVAPVSPATVSIVPSGAVDRSVGIAWEIAVAVVALTLLAGGLVAVVVAALRDQPDRTEPAVAPADSIGPESDLSFPREDEPRRAVIATWAWIERVLAHGGLAREAGEAPLEYAARVGTQRPERAVTLGLFAQLYERARFSVHHIDEAMRRAAVAAAHDIAEEES